MEPTAPPVVVRWKAGNGSQPCTFWKWQSSSPTRLGADCGSDHELLIAKFRLKLKTVGKITRPFRYDLNKITCDYTVKVTNRFKELDMIECLKNYGWKFITFVQEAVEKTTTKKVKCRKKKWLPEEALQIAEKRREAKGKGEKKRDTHLNAELQRRARRDKKDFLGDK